MVKNIKKILSGTLVVIMVSMPISGSVFALENNHTYENTKFKITNKKDNEIPVFLSMEEGVDSGQKTFFVQSKDRSTVRQKVTIIYDKLLVRGKYLKDHPRATNSYYRVGSYNFSYSPTVTTSVTFNASLGPFSVSVGNVNSSGYNVPVPGGTTVKSKPTIRGDIYEVRTKTQEYSSSGALIKTTYKTFNKARNVQGWYRIIK